MDSVETIGVVGAGTMGAGIAQLAAQSGAVTLLYDPQPEALERGVAQIERALSRSVEKGRLDAARAAAVRERLRPVASLQELAPAGLVVEAAPERLEVKVELFSALAGIVGPDCVLATNTSSLSVTELAAATTGSERVVGLHFFNPAPVMRLVEVVAGEDSSAAAVATARAVGEAMGKHVIDARDVPGFLVNRVNRPYSLEALRLLQEGVASVEQIDRIARLGGGFRMGPFELMDLIGIDTNHAVAEGFYRQTYGEPRYRPSPLSARKIAAGRLGRKTGRGWYVYDDDAPYRDPDLEPPAGGGGDGRVVVILGDSPVLDGLRAAAYEAGFDVREAAADAWNASDAWLTVGDAPGVDLLLLGGGSLHHQAPGSVGFHALAPFAACGLVELTSTDRTPPELLERTEGFVAALGRHVEHVADAPGLVLGRIVAQLVNEAAFLLGEGNGTADDVDAGLRLGVNHPRGPVAWSDEIGLGHVRDVLDALHRELGEERYRAAPLLRRRAALGAGLA